MRPGASARRPDRHRRTIANPPGSPVDRPTQPVLTSVRRRRPRAAPARPRVRARRPRTCRSRPVRPLSPALEPAAPLLRRAMRERVRVHAAAAARWSRSSPTASAAVIASSRSPASSCSNTPRAQTPGVAVGLQLRAGPTLVRLVRVLRRSGRPRRWSRAAAVRGGRPRGRSRTPTRSPLERRAGAPCRRRRRGRGRRSGRPGSRTGRPPRSRHRSPCRPHRRRRRPSRARTAGPPLERAPQAPWTSLNT